MTKIENGNDFKEYIKNEIVNYEVDFMITNDSEWLRNYKSKNKTVNEFAELLESLNSKQLDVLKDLSKTVVYDCLFHLLSVIENKEPFNGDFEFSFQIKDGEKIILNELNGLNPDFLSASIVEDYDW